MTLTLKKKHFILSLVKNCMFSTHCLNLIQFDSTTHVLTTEYVIITGLLAPVKCKDGYVINEPSGLPHVFTLSSTLSLLKYYHDEFLQKHIYFRSTLK